ncbi:MAG: thrombospondin type 3 repeat-containing protein [Myxococcales bacterium]
MRWLSIALVVALPLSGCIIPTTSDIDRDEDGITNSTDNCPDLYNPDQQDENNDGVGDACEGDITFYWTFGGHSCNQAPEVEKVHITLTGPRGVEDLEAGGYYKCSPANVDGIRLTNFVVGSYTFRIDALDLAGVTVYTTTGTLHVTSHSDPVVTVDLPPVSRNGTAQLFWQFRDKNNAIVPCASTGIADGTPVSKVRVYINNEAPQDLQCTQNDQNGKPVQGWSWDLSAGSYQVVMDGIVVRTGSDGKPYEELWYSATQTVTVISNQTNNVTFDLLPVASGAHFKPQLVDVNGVPYATCAEANVKAFFIELTDYNDPPTGTTPYWDANCDTILKYGFFWSYLPAFETYNLSTGKWQGTWTVHLQAWDAANSVHNVVAEKTEQTILYAGNQDWMKTIKLVR